MTRKPYLYLLPAVAALSLVACGGGGGGGTPPPEEPVSITATLSGKAAKGVIIRGRVVANELNPDGSVKNANVGSATTDDNGRYSLTTNSSYQGGPVEIIITRADDTLMVCDAVSGCGSNSDPNDNNGTVDFGERYSPASLNMSAMLPSVANGATVSAQITPFTHMAAKRARKAAQTGGTLDAATVATANQAVSNLLGGLNILQIEPVDVTDDSAVNAISATDDRIITYASLVAAIAEIADDDPNSGEPDLEKVLNELELDDNGSFSATKLGEISDKAKLTRQQTPKPDDLSGSFTKIDDSVTLAGSGGSITPVTGFAGDSNLDKAYAFMADLRTWGTVLGNELDNPSRAFETQLDLSDRAADTLTGTIGDALGAAADAIFDNVDGLQSGDQLSGYTVFGGSFTAGTIVKTTGDLVDTYTITDAVFDSNSNPGNDTTITSMVVKTPKSIAIPDNTSVIMGIDSISASDALASLVVGSGSMTLVLNQEYQLDLNAQNASNPSVKSVAFDFDASITQLLTDDGTNQNNFVTATDPVTFTGEVRFTVYPVVDGNNEILDGVPGSLTLAGSITSQSGQQLSAELVASLPNAASISPTNSPLNLDSSYASNNDTNNDGVDLQDRWAYYQINGNDFVFITKMPFPSQTNATWNPNGSVDVSGSLGSFNDDNRGQGYASIGHWFSVNGGFFGSPPFSFYLPGQGEYQMLMSNLGTSEGYYAYALVEPDVDFNLDAEAASVGLTFGAQLAGVPAATFNIIADKKAARDTGEVSLTISYGARSIVFDVSGNPIQGNPDFDEGTATVTITNSDGVVLVLTGTTVGDPSGDDVRGSLTIDGIQIATVDTVGGITKVTYIDGTFEIF